MQRALLALHIPQDAYIDQVDRVIEEVFESPSSSFCPDGLTHHYLYLQRTRDDVVRHTQTGCTQTVEALTALLHDSCAFLRDSSFLQDDATGQLHHI